MNDPHPLVDVSSPARRVMFVITSMPVGGAETLLVNLTRRFDRDRIQPMVGCLKEKGVLGEEIQGEIPVFENLIGHKYDIAVAQRLRKLFKVNRVDAVVTVGAGDKMFWGRLAAKGAGVPVILSALHSTGWPDGVGKLNRLLTRITDGFIAVARNHADFLVEFEKFPDNKVFMIPNGIDTSRFTFDPQARNKWRAEHSIDPFDPVVGIVAALRPEKNHELFLDAAEKTLAKVPNAKFVIAGDGERRETLESIVAEKSLTDAVRFLGSVSDIPGVLSMVDMFALTSHNEASPVSILEALSCNRPVVATDVGSIKESVLDGKTGFLVQPGDVSDVAEHWVKLLTDEALREEFGRQGRAHVVDNSSLDSMTTGYTELVESIYRIKQNEDSGNNPLSTLARWSSWGSTHSTAR